MFKHEYNNYSCLLSSWYYEYFEDSWMGFLDVSAAYLLLQVKIPYRPIRKFVGAEMIQQWSGRHQLDGSVFHPRTWVQLIIIYYGIKSVTALIKPTVLAAKAPGEPIKWLCTFFSLPRPYSVLAWLGTLSFYSTRKWPRATILVPFFVQPKTWEARKKN